MQYALPCALSAILMTSTVLAKPPVDVAPAPTVTAEVKASRLAAEQFGTALKEALQQAISSGGLIGGMSVCHDQAGQMTEKRSQELGMLVGRTSLKIRNPQNAPDNWELAVLKQFEARKAQGEPVEKLEFSAIIPDDQNQRTFRYMKAIPTAPLCLSCHGESLSAEVDAKLKELYPNDKARGFKSGDLRGAFTIAKPMP